MTKSYVAMGDEVCPVCGATHSTSVVIDKRLQETFEEGKHVIVGIDLCPEHKKLHEEGYVALVEIDPTKSKPPYTIENTFRTGAIAHLRREVAPNIFQGLPPDAFNRPLVFVEPGVIDKLSELTPKEDEQ